MGDRHCRVGVQKQLRRRLPEEVGPTDYDRVEAREIVAVDAA
jgi:hypothetical protein